MQALTKRNLKVQPFKVGPDYIDPSYHTFITGRYSRNLDSEMLEDEKIKYIVKEASKDADISVVEGVMGLYDGYGIDLNDCTSSYTSKILKAPVILVINAKAMAASAAAMVLGYKMLDRDVNIKGVITNNVKSESHYKTLKSAIEKYTGIEVLGYFPPNKNFSLESRHLGLIPSVEMDSLKQKFDNLADEIEKYIDVDRIIALSETEEIESNFDLETFTLCFLPTFCRVSSFIVCGFILILLTPCFLRTSKISLFIVSGLPASTVNSFILLKSNSLNNPFIKVSISSGDKVVGVPPPIYKVSISLLLSLRSSATPLAS